MLEFVPVDDGIEVVFREFIPQPIDQTDRIGITPIAVADEYCEWIHGGCGLTNRCFYRGWHCGSKRNSAGQIAGRTEREENSEAALTGDTPKA